MVAEGVDTLRPGLYEWHIEGVGRYIGKYKRIRRPTREYWRNVVRLLAGRNYRKGEPDGYRRIHRELAAAFREGRAVTLTILENCPPGEIDRRERELIAERGDLNGPTKPPQVPN